MLQLCFGPIQKWMTQQFVRFRSFSWIFLDQALYEIACHGAHSFRIVDLILIDLN
jgi:hypothetical protein